MSKKIILSSMSLLALASPMLTVLSCSAEVQKPSFDADKTTSQKKEVLENAKFEFENEFEEEATTLNEGNRRHMIMSTKSAAELSKWETVGIYTGKDIEDVNTLEKLTTAFGIQRHYWTPRFKEKEIKGASISQIEIKRVVNIAERDVKEMFFVVTFGDSTEYTVTKELGMRYFKDQAKADAFEQMIEIKEKIMSMFPGKIASTKTGNQLASVPSEGRIESVARFSELFGLNQFNNVPGINQVFESFNVTYNIAPAEPGTTNRVFPVELAFTNKINANIFIKARFVVVPANHVVEADHIDQIIEKIKGMFVNNEINSVDPGFLGFPEFRENQIIHPAQLGIASLVMRPIEEYSRHFGLKIFFKATASSRPGVNEVNVKLVIQRPADGERPELARSFDIKVKNDKELNLLNRIVNGIRVEKLGVSTLEGINSQATLDANASVKEEIMNGILRGLTTGTNIQLPEGFTKGVEFLGMGEMNRMMKVRLFLTYKGQTAHAMPTLVFKK